MNFVYTVNPNGGVVYRRAVEVPFSKSHLLERILSAENIRRAWKQVRANKGAPGIDGVTVEHFIIMVKSLSAGNRVMSSIRRFLERELRLTVNGKKSNHCPYY